MDPLEGTLLRVNADERISEFAHFYLRIHLRIVKQLALPFLTFCDISPLLLSLRTLGRF